MKRLEAKRWPGFNIEEKEVEKSPYALTRSGFLDAVVNRIEVAYAYPSTLFASIHALKNRRDSHGRVKVMLYLNTSYTSEEQVVSLVHEMTHVDRNSWELGEGMDPFSDIYHQLELAEEDVVNEATVAFIEQHRSLAELALNHVLLRSQGKPDSE
jgi:hypothetical protein